GSMSFGLLCRIGRIAVIRVGLFANDRLSAVTAIRIVEIAITMVLSKSVCDLMRSKTPQAASTHIIRSANSRVGRGLGIIALDRKGRYGAAHSTKHLCWATLDSKGGLARMNGQRVP